MNLSRMVSSQVKQSEQTMDTLGIVTNCIMMDFVVNRFSMKLFQTSNIDLVKCCQSYFCCELPSVIHDRRVRKFDLRYRNHSNLFC